MKFACIKKEYVIFIKFELAFMDDSDEEQEEDEDMLLACVLVE